MNLLGMGPAELLLIVVLALIVFGPAKLPEIMAQVGKAIGDFRRATSELSDEFNRTIQAELQETRAMVDDTKATFSDAKASVYDAHAQVNSAITGTPAPVRTAVPGEALPAPNGSSTEVYASGSNGTAPASALPPAPALADTTQWSWETSPGPTPPSAPAGADAPATPSAASVASAQDAPKTVPPAPSPADEHAVRDDLLPPY